MPVVHQPEAANFSVTGFPEVYSCAELQPPPGVRVDPSGKLAGRGAYLHDKRDCWVRGMRGALTHALKAELTAEDRARLEEFMNTLPTHDEAGTNG